MGYQRRVHGEFKMYNQNNLARASASRTSRSSRTSRTNMSVTKRDLPEIHVRRETKYGIDSNPTGINYNHVPEEYLLSLSDDSDYCSSDWVFFDQLHSHFHDISYCSVSPIYFYTTLYMPF